VIYQKGRPKMAIFRDDFIKCYNVNQDEHFKVGPRDAQFEAARLERILAVAKQYGVDNVSFRECRNLLPKKSLLDRDAIADLFSEIGNKTVGQKEFAKLYLKRRNDIQEKLQRLYQEKSGLERNSEYSEIQRKRTASSRPAYGKLIVKVLKIKPIDEIDPLKKFRVHLMCNHQAIETRSMHFLDDEVTVGELFSFQIDSNQSGPTTSNLEVSLKEQNVSKLAQLTESHSFVALTGLRNQNVQEFDLNLMNKCTIRLQCQLIYDQAKLHHFYTQDYRRRLRELVPRMSDYQVLLKKYDLPITHKGLGVGKFVQSVFQGDVAANKLEDMMETYGLTNTQKASQVFVYLYLILVCFASYARAMFLDQGIALFAFFFNMESRRWSEKKYRNCIYGLIVALVLDLWWISQYLLNWSGTSSEVPFVHITRIFTIITFVWRIVLALFFWKCSRDLKTRTNLGIRVDRFKSENGHHNQYDIIP